MPENYIPGGYILISRRLIESEIWEKPPLYLKVWIYILSKARHRADKGYERGELLISIPELQEACSHKIGFRKETPTKKQIFNILEFLRNPYEGAYEGNDDSRTSATMIGTTKTTRGLVVKVHNYNVYQDPKNYERNNEGNAESNDKGTPEGTAEGTRGEHYTQELKELKNSKNEKKEEQANSALFEKWWKIYPKKTGPKKNIEKKFEKAIKKVGEEQFFAATEIYLKTQDQVQYICAPEVFLNQERYSKDNMETYQKVVDEKNRKQNNSFGNPENHDGWQLNKDLLERREKERQADMEQGKLPF